MSAAIFGSGVPFHFILWVMCKDFNMNENPFENMGHHPMW